MTVACVCETRYVCSRTFMSAAAMSDAGLTQWLSNLADRTPAPAAERLLVPWQLKQRRCLRWWLAILKVLALAMRSLNGSIAIKQTHAACGRRSNRIRSAQRSLAPHKNDPDRHETLLPLARAASVPPMTAFEDTLDLAQTFLAVANYTNKNLATDTLMVADIYAWHFDRSRLMS